MEAKRLRKVTIPSIVILPLLIISIVVFEILYHNEPNAIYRVIVLVSAFIALIPLTLLILIIPGLIKEKKNGGKDNEN